MSTEPLDTGMCTLITVPLMIMKDQTDLTKICESWAVVTVHASWLGLFSRRNYVRLWLLFDVYDYQILTIFKCSVSLYSCV